MQIHMCSPYQLPSTNPACDCQEITPLTICDSPVGSCYIVGPASLFMAIGSPGNTGGSIQRSSSNKRLRVARQNLRFKSQLYFKTVNTHTSSDSDCSMGLSVKYVSMVTKCLCAKSDMCVNLSLLITSPFFFSSLIGPMSGKLSVAAT